MASKSVSVEAASRLLLLEGREDQHVVKALAKRHGLITAELGEICTVKDFNQEDGGIDTLLEDLSIALRGSKHSTIGIVIDADTNLADRWKQLRNILAKPRITLPDEPLPNGTIALYTVNEEAQKYLNIGIWIMPNNQTLGMIEDFVRLLVPENDDLKPFADECLDTMITKRVPRFNPDLHRAKAFIHTWLAWQKDPGKPMGLAITMKYLDAHQPIALDFLAWMRQLFGIEKETA